MNLERNDYYRDLGTLHDQCKGYLYYHTILTMKDGSTFDGIIENVDPDSITVLVGEEAMERESGNQSDEQRQYHDFGRPRGRFRRFRRQNFPISNLVALSLLPYVAPQPYPYYPYYPY